MALYSSEIASAISSHNEKLATEREGRGDAIRLLASPIKDHRLYQQFKSIVSAAKLVVDNAWENKMSAADEVNIKQVFYQTVTGKDAYESIGTKAGLLINYSLQQSDRYDPVLYVPTQEGGKKEQCLIVELDRGEEIAPNSSTFRINVPILSPGEEQLKYIMAPIFQSHALPFVDLKIYKGESATLTDGGKIEVTLAEVANSGIIKEADELISLINASADNVAQGLHMSQGEHAFEEKVKVIMDRLQVQDKSFENTDSQTKELANFLGKAVILARGILEKQAKS